jgi:creatinine amidohydrolase
MTLLADQTWRDAQRLGEGASLLLVPLGSTEQHGMHLPLSTDTDIANAIAARAADVLPSAVVAPALPYGSSGEHAGFAGTLSIGQEAVESVVIELVRSASATFDWTVFVSAHGGNLEPLRRACELLESEGHAVLLWWPRWSGDAHAGRTETSVMLAIEPDTVELQRAVPGNSTPIELLIDDLRKHGVRPVSPTGVLGDPTGASACEGARLLEAAVDDLTRTVTAWIAGRA